MKKAFFLLMVIIVLGAFSYPGFFFEINFKMCNILASMEGSMGWWIAGFVILLFVAALQLENYRLSCVEKWCRRHGFARIFPLTDDMLAQWRQLAESFGYGYSKKWWFALSNTSSDFAITIAFYSENKKCFSLVILKHFGADLPEFRLQNSNHDSDLFVRIIMLPLYPLLYIAQQLIGSLMKSPQIEPSLVDFSEDAGFDKAFKVSGDSLTAKKALNSGIRTALVQKGWQGDILARGDKLIWRHKGHLWPSHLDRMLTEVDLFHTMFHGIH